ncbi:hemophore [Mycobacterium decipiens]|uniref:Hemophore n=1 Tax=Mycobacterium decipiens TaxID=1430326 RepID=A0A1X2LXZ5_9MYCO|nr:hemophore [Mycobacterium decipiens]
MKTLTATTRRRLFAALIAVAVPGAAVALLAEPAATGASDPCAASEVARTVGSVAKSTGDYLDSHPETNHAITAVLQQPGGTQSFVSLKAYLEANPKVAGDLQSLSQPLTNLSTQCTLPISVPQAIGLMQAAQGAGGLPNPPAGIPPAGIPPVGTGGLPGPARVSHVG